MNYETVFSPDRRYRYTLWRRWHDDYGFFNQPEHGDSYVNFIGLNPSTADEVANDQTISTCVRFSKDWGYPAFCMTNIFAWRDTKPANMLKAEFPTSPNGERVNDEWLVKIAKGAGIVVAAWGAHADHQNRGEFVADMLKANRIKLKCLAVNDDGSPHHPLYLPRLTKPTPWPKPKPLHVST